MKTLIRRICQAAMAGLLLTSSAIAADPVKIGVGIAQTGFLAPTAEPILNAYKLWAKQLNDKGGLDVAGERRPIELVVYDDQSDFSKEAAIYEKLITDDKVDLLLSPYTTAAHLAVVGVLERYQFPMVGSTASSEQLKQIKPGNIWFPSPTMPNQIATEYAKLLKAQGVTKAAMAVLQTPYSLETAGLLRGSLKEQGIELLVDESYDFSTKDLTAIVSKIKASGAEAVMALTLPGDAILYMKAAREQDLQAPYQFLLIGPTGDWFQKMFGNDLDGILTAGHWSPSQAKWPKAKIFYDDYVAAYGMSPDYLDVVLSWISAEITEAAVAVAGLDKDKLREAISTRTFDTINGPIKFDGVQNATTPVMFLQLQGSTPQIVWPADLATAPLKTKGPWAK